LANLARGELREAGSREKRIARRRIARDERGTESFESDDGQIIGGDEMRSRIWMDRPPVWAQADSLRPFADYLLIGLIDWTRYRVHALEKAWHHIPFWQAAFAGPQAQLSFACCSV
jgi:hypothetical protein